jgi:protein-S-isoprenylcysteine O-methyltransferase Ste14
VGGCLLPGGHGQPEGEKPSYSVVSDCFRGLYLAARFPFPAHDSFLGLPGLLPVPLNTILFVPLLTLGLLLIVWSIVHFARVRGTPIPSIPPPRLVTTGPYAYARNPMHTGIYILLFGLGVLFRSVSLVAIFLPLFVLLDVLELKKIEETELERRLGSEYLEYKKRVPMFFPRLKGRGAS